MPEQLLALADEVIDEARDVCFLAQSGHHDRAHRCPLLGGKADIAALPSGCLLLNQSGHVAPRPTSAVC